MKSQLHQPNPRVNRTNRRAVLLKRIRSLEKLNLTIGDIRNKRLQDYKNELRLH